MVAVIVGVGIGYLARGLVEAPSSSRTGTVTNTSVLGSLVCVKPADQSASECGQRVQDTGGPHAGELRVGDVVNYRIAHKPVGGAQLVLIVAMA